MEKKNFLGLEGLKYFWTKIETKVVKIIEEQIAEIIAEAPENLNTLKEIADWISTHEDSASAMNTAILANKTAISGKADKSHTHTKSQITDFAHTHDDRYFTETEVTNKLAGKSDTGHTHTKSQITDFPTSLPANGGTATKATQDGNGNVITSTYVKKSGDTLTGPIVMKANQYTLDTAQLDMKNSDIKGANAIWFEDHAEVGEGLKFPRSSGSNYDFMRLDDGKIKVAQNVTGNASTATESIVAYTSDIPTSLPANGGNSATATTAESANKIEPKYTSLALETVTSGATKYIKLADCLWNQTGTLQVHLFGNVFEDTLVINFGGGNSTKLTLCGHYSSNSNHVLSVIAKKGKAWNSNYSIYVKIDQLTTCTVQVALLKGDCTIDITESTTAPTNISEWAVRDGFFGNLTGNVTGTANKAVSVVDYGDTSKTIQIGYTGAGATVNNLSYIAGYLTGGTQIKNVSKDVLKSWIGLSNYLPLSGGTVTGATQFDNYVKLNAWDGYGTGTANFWYDGNNKFVEIQNATALKLAGVNVSKEGHTHTKSQITDFPTSLPANGGTATTATNLKVSNHDANNTTYYPIWANGKGDGSTARGTYTSTNLNYIPATGNFKSKQFTVGGGVSLTWNSTTKSLDFIFA